MDSPLSRRRMLHLCSVTSIAAFSGCVADPGDNGGLLEILCVDAPDGATVTPSGDERLRSVEPIQTALSRAAERSVADQRVDSSEFSDVRAALSPLSYYERSDPQNDSTLPSGIYLRHNGSTYVASLWPYCTDSILGSAESEEGDYGRGGCLNPEERPGDSLNRST